MLVMDDYAFHPKTGKIGRVIGYGSKIVKNAYLSTLKVLVIEETNIGQKICIMEDLCANWRPVNELS